MTRPGDPYFFGYGSLVNRATHAYPRAGRARVTGWARIWRATTLRRVDHDQPDAADIMIYQVELQHISDGGEHPILLSYLDCVVQGYLREFGDAGAARFFETTTGWDMGLRDDRAAPQYPRAQTLTDRERGFVDAALRDLGVPRSS